MARDYYTILGIKKEATEEEIKKAYKKSAMKWHPDKNRDRQEEAERRFKDIAEAYDVLSDPEKRKIYDQYGEEGLKGGIPTGNAEGMPGGFTRYEFHGDPNEIFRNIFGNNGFGGFGFGGDDIFSSFEFERGPKFFPHKNGAHGSFPMGGESKKRPYVVDLNLSLEELYTGITKKLKISRKTKTPGRSPQNIFDIKVKPGWKAGTKITFEGEGDEEMPGQAQDVVFVVKEKPHQAFTRSGSNLIYRKKAIPLVDALTGFKFNIQTLDKRTLEVDVKDVVSPTYRKVIQGEGMPISKEPGKRGDLIVEFDIIFPQSLSDDSKLKIRQAFGRSSEGYARNKAG
eukprot:768103-Hanusia_phi.AAC.1